MALGRTDNLDRTVSEFELRDDDRFTGYEPERERSHFGAFLMGGVVVAGGLLAFLYYDTDNLNGRTNNDFGTASVSRNEAVAPGAALPSLRLGPGAGTDAGSK